MGFIDKVKESVKSGAGMAATKAQEEYEKIQARRELADAYESLGRKAHELADRGEISHTELGPPIEHVRAANDKLDAIGKEPESSPPAQPESPAEQPPTAT
jgi:hypothetical protein